MTVPQVDELCREQTCVKAPAVTDMLEFTYVFDTCDGILERDISDEVQIREIRY